MDLEKGSRPSGKIRNTRKLTRFLCQELLYDYMNGDLDDERKLAVEEFLSSDDGLARELDSLLSSQEYCKELSRTNLSEPLYKYFVDHQSWVEKILLQSKWKNWPPFAKWTIEAALISAIAGFVWVTFPWQKLGKVMPADKQIELVKVEGEKSGKEGALNKASKEGQEGAAFKVVASDEVNVVGNEDSAGQENIAANEIESEPDMEIAKPSGSLEAHLTKKLEVKSESSKISEVKVEAKQVKVKNKVAALKGELYRGFMKIDGVRKLTPELVAKIKNLGGEKAGNVKLGWEKPNGNYFHFSLPESNYQGLLDDLRRYGPVRIYKDPHWRVMPEGKLRFILMIEDDSLTDK